MSVFISFKNYLFFHFILETFCVVVACAITIFGNSRYTARSYSLVNYIGIAYAFIAIVDFLHVISFKGSNIISTGSDIPTQLWILGRYLESISFLIAFVFWNKKFHRYKVALAYSVITFSSIYLIFYTNYFPTCHIDGVGLTTFKIVSEYIIIFICFINATLIYKNKRHLKHDIVESLILSCIFAALAEASFTLYVDVYGIFNAVGHILKAICYLFICKAVFFENIEDPLERTISMYNEALEKNLKLSFDMAIDFMTGLYNRRYLDSIINNIIVDNVEEIILVAFDMNNLKMINDCLGHINGDKAILEIARVLKKNFSKKDVLARIGGDEFLAVVFNSTVDDVKAILDSIDEDLKISGEDMNIPLSIAYGMSHYKGKIDKDVFDRLFDEADKNMYKYKAMIKSTQNDNIKSIQNNNFDIKA